MNPSDRVTGREFRGSRGLLAAAVAAAAFHAGTLRAERPASLTGLDAVYPSIDSLYIDLHRNPELSLQEEKTAAKLAERLRAAGYQVSEHAVGSHD